MAGTSYTVSLRGGGPWGFRLQGGKDFGSPLAISKVTPGSKADVVGIKSGDYILEVNGGTTENMSHFEAQDSVRRAGQNLDLLLQRKEGTKSVVVTETVHSAKVDHKFNARAKPFGASSPPSHAPQPSAAVAVHTSPAGSTTWQPPTFQAQRAPVAKTGPVGLSGPPTPPPPPNPATYVRGSADHLDSGVSRPSHDDRDLAQHFKLDISDDGDVGFADEPPSWGHPPDPKVQSKSFKRLQKHLQETDEDDLPPPPPEAYNDPEEDADKLVQSRTFKMLQDAVEGGDAPGSVFDRQKADRSKPSNNPLPKMYRPSPPVFKPARDMPVAPPAPVMARPGQPAPVALPGMVQMNQPSEPVRHPTQKLLSSASPAAVSPEPVRNPTQKLPSSASPAAVSPTSSPGQPEWKRTPSKPPSAHSVEETRTPFCDACGEEVFGPFVSAIGKAWHPHHFVCDGCGDSLQNQGFIEEGGKLYCEKDFNKFFAPHCETCKQPIVGPKSLHSCPPAVPPPSSAMLQAIREGSMNSKKPAEVAAKSKNKRFNNALTLKKEPEENHAKLTNGFQSSYPTPVYGVSYLQKRTSSDSKNGFPASSGISNTSKVETLNNTRVEPGVGSIREKVVSLKGALRSATEREAKAKKAIPPAVKRFKEAKILLAKLERKRFIAEDKVTKLEDRVQNQQRRLDSKYRSLTESCQVNRKIERQKSDDLRNIRNIEYELTEVKAAREASMQRVREASRRAVVIQSALQNAQDRQRELFSRERTLQDMLEMYRKRMKDLGNTCQEKGATVENKFLQMNLMEDYIADSNERFGRAERRLLPLKIHINQLHDAIDQARNETRHASYLLANCQQRLKGRKYTYYPFDK